jgi:glycosyltransferase involved in cell wall biosynthesis
VGLLSGNYFYNSQFNQKRADAISKKVDIDRKLPVVFSAQAIEDIALITMEKNESDIIFENLVWHFALGFRKFVVIDNLSTDTTRHLIDKFAQLTKDHAQVIIMDDPIFVHIQSRITTGSYDLTRSVWPEVKWVFPVDADEFWSPEQNLHNILTKIPSNIDTISTLKTQYYASEDYSSFGKDSPFYQKLHYRNKSFAEMKVAIKAQPNIMIMQGNHGIWKLFSYPKKFKKLKLANFVKVISGNNLGLQMREFPLRSEEQVHSKLTNGMKVNKLAQDKGYIGQDCGLHWNAYSDYIAKYKDQAASVRFKESFINSKDAIDDPIPFWQAKEIFNQVIKS